MSRDVALLNTVARCLSLTPLASSLVSFRHIANSLDDTIQSITGNAFAAWLDSLPLRELQPRPQRDFPFADEVIVEGKGKSAEGLLRGRIFDILYRSSKVNKGYLALAAQLGDLPRITAWPLSRHESQSVIRCLLMYEHLDVVNALLNLLESRAESGASTKLLEVGHEVENVRSAAVMLPSDQSAATTVLRRLLEHGGIGHRIGVDLVTCIDRHYVKKFDVLMDFGPFPHSELSSPLLYAIQRDSLHFTMKLLHGGANPFIKTMNSYPFQFATSHAVQSAIVSFMLESTLAESKASLLRAVLRDSVGSGVHCAKLFNSVASLVDQGQSIDQLTGDCSLAECAQGLMWTLVQRPCREPAPLVNVLHERGALFRVTTVEANHAMLPIHIAASRGFTPQVIAMLEIDPSLVDEKSSTPDGEGKTPEQLARNNRCVRCAEAIQAFAQRYSKHVASV